MPAKPFSLLQCFRVLNRLSYFGLWVITGFIIGWITLADLSNVAAWPTPDLNRFDPDVYPAIDVGHTPPALVQSDETVRLEFMFACGYLRTLVEKCRPHASLFVARGPFGEFSPVALQEEDRDSLRVLTAEIPATDVNGQGFRYYLEVEDHQANVHIRYPVVGVIEPTVLPGFTVIEVPVSEPAVAEQVLRLPWGNGPEEVGLSMGSEQAIIGPDSLDVAPDGTIVLLDHVNARVMLSHPTEYILRSYAVPIKGVGDVEIDAQGWITVLDLVGEPISQSKARVPQLYRLGPGGVLEVTAPVFARYPSKLNEDLTVMDMADVRVVVPLNANGQPQAREAQRLSRHRPRLQVQWLNDSRTRLADIQRGLAFELRSEHPLGAVAQFAQTPQGYVVVFEWHDLTVVWFDTSGRILKNVSLPNKQYSVLNPSSRVAVDHTGAVYVLGSTLEGVEVLKLSGPRR